MSFQLEKKVTNGRNTSKKYNVKYKLIQILKVMNQENS